MDEELDENINNIIVLNDENGNEVRFEFLDLIEYESEEYVVLLPVIEEGEEDDGEVVILQVDDSDEDSDEESYTSVDDEQTLTAVFEIFKDITTAICETPTFVEIIFIEFFIRNHFIRLGFFFIAMFISQNHIVHIIFKFL